MMKRPLVSAVLVLASALPAHADLRYTLRVEVRETAAPSESVPPMLVKIGETLLQAIAPGGSSRATVTLTEEGSRAESSTAYQGVPAGAVLLRMADGRRLVLNPADRTYWKLPSQRLDRTRSRPANVAVTSQRTGRRSRIAGVRAEQVTFSVRYDVRGAAGSAPAGAPAAVTLDGEFWVASTVKTPPALKPILNPALQALGLDDLVGDRLVVRQVLRSALFNGHEVESSVEDLDTRVAAPDALDIPADYREIPNPTRAGGR